MSGYLLDTNVLSELVRKKPSRDVVRRLRQVRSQRLTTSAVCVLELRYGAARHPQRRHLGYGFEPNPVPDVLADRRRVRDCTHL